MAGILDALTPTTIANYARGAWDSVCENFPFFAEAKKRGNLKYDVGGDSLQGPIEAGRFSAIVSAPGMDLTDQFVPRVRHAKYNFPWAEIAAGQYIDRGLLRRNAGDQALVRLRDTEIPAMLRDLIVGTSGGLAYQILQQNGPNYSGSGLPIYGFPSFLLQPGATGVVGFDGVATATAIAPADTDKEATPSSTSQQYAGLNLYLNGITGVDTPEADAWTPTLVNTSYTGWTGTADDEDDAILLFTQHAVNRASRFSANDNTKLPSAGFLDPVFYGYMGNKIAAKQTIYVQSSQKEVDTPNLGFQPHKLMHAGLTWMWDKNMPSETAYVVNFDQLTLNFQTLYRDQENGSPLKVSGEDAGIIETAINFDPTRRGYLVSGTIPGQMQCNPRYFVRCGNYS